MEIKKVGVAGCGLMGGGIAQTAAQAGFSVRVLETEQRFIDKGMAAIRRNLDGAAAKGQISAAAADEVFARIAPTTDYRDLADSDIVVEAIIENLDAKKELFGKLASVCGEHAIFCSNTSSIPIIEMAASVKNPERFAGLHFFNPVPVMKLVEVIRTIRNTPEVIRIVTDFGKALGKTTIQAKDRAGFVVNLLLIPFLLDAIRALEAGIATRDDIDTGMTLGCAHPMGPLTLLDFVGLDTTYFITQVLYDEFKDAKYASPPLLKQMVKAGLYGRKSGRGFYDYGAA